MSQRHPTPPSDELRAWLHDPATQWYLHALRAELSRTKEAVFSEDLDLTTAKARVDALMYAILLVERTLTAKEARDAHRRRQ